MHRTRLAGRSMGPTFDRGKVAFGGGLGFGIERIGLMAARAPLATLIVMAILTLFAAAGAAKLQTGGLLISLLRSDTPEFRTFERLREEFSSYDSTVHLIVAGKQDILVRARLEQLRTLHLELQLAEPVANVLSIFSIPGVPHQDGYAPPLFPEDLPTGETFEVLKRQVLTHPLIRDQLFVQSSSTGRQAILFVIMLRPEANSVEHQRASIAAIQALLRKSLPDSGLAYQLLGTPVMEANARENTDRDLFLFNSLGLAVGILVCLAYFRQLRPVVILTAVSVTALTWSLGIFGWLEVKVSVLLNAVLPLVLVLTFCDSMHLMFAMRRRLRAGEGPRQAASHAVATVGPACVLTSLTTAVALISMVFATSEMVETFAWTAALATLMALLVVLMLVPALAVLFLRPEPVAAREETAAGLELALERACARLAAPVERHARRISIVAVLITLALTAVHLQLRPAFRLSDQMSDEMRTQIDATAEFGALALAFPIEVIVRPPAAAASDTSTTRAVVRSTTQVLEAQPLMQKVWSIELIRAWLENSGVPAQTIEAFMQKLPRDLKRRFYNERTGSLLVTGYLPDLTADETLRLLAKIEHGLAGTRARHPDFEIIPTGLSVVSAQQSTRIINQLNAGLFAAIVLVLLLIGLAFRSVMVPVYSLVPNFLPLVATGTALAAMGRGFDYTSVITLTVAFGIAVDNAIHFLNRVRLDAQNVRGTAEAVALAMQRIGPVVIATTAVLILGVGVALLSALPPTRQFGMLFMVTLSVALVADLMILPALVLSWRRRSRKPAG
jgi:predicted RND superfamily exporter protein